jgi:hypothetical protein
LELATINQKTAVLHQLSAQAKGQLHLAAGVADKAIVNSPHR